MVASMGFEPMTPSLGNLCSIQLSYETMKSGFGGQILGFVKTPFVDLFIYRFWFLYSAIAAFHDLVRIYRIHEV